jgi:hypothetical protein
MPKWQPRQSQKILNITIHMPLFLVATDDGVKAGNLIDKLIAENPYNKNLALNQFFS